MSTQMNIRIEPELKEKVSRFARAEGKTTSDVVRELLEKYISSRDIAAYVDNLWERIGGRLSAQGVTAERILGAIQEIRRGRRMRIVLSTDGLCGPRLRMFNRK